MNRTKTQTRYIKGSKRWRNFQRTQKGIGSRKKVSLTACRVLFSPGSESDFLRLRTDTRSLPLAKRRRQWARLCHCNQRIRFETRLPVVDKFLFITWSKTLRQLRHLHNVEIMEERQSTWFRDEEWWLQQRTSTDKSPEFTHGGSICLSDVTWSSNFKNSLHK